MSRRRTKERKAPGLEQSDFRRIINPLTRLSIMSEEEENALHSASMQLLAEHGIRFSLAKARALLKTHGANVDEASQMVRFDPDLIMESIAKAPRGFTLQARNPKHDLMLDD